jgi:GntR family transcriptional regulator
LVYDPDVLVRIDPRSDRPIYLQIARSIAHQIDGGALGAEKRLPSARALGASLKVNMHTVLKAYAHLQEEGYVEMKRGRGGVHVSRTPGIERAAKELATTAKRQGMTRSELTNLIGEVW